MRARLIGGMMLLFLVQACSRGNKIPGDVLSQDAMSDIFIELSMAEAFIENFQTKDSTTKKDSLIGLEMDKILAIRKADDKQFLESYRFYKAHPNLFKVLMDTAYAKVQRIRDTSRNRIPTSRL